MPGGFALPNDVAGRFIRATSPHGSRQEAVERQIGDALQADDPVSPAALAGLQGKTNHCTTSGRLDEEPPIGLDYRLPILWNGNGVDYAGQSRILTSQMIRPCKSIAITHPATSTMSRLPAQETWHSLGNLSGAVIP